MQAVVGFRKNGSVFSALVSETVGTMQLVILFNNAFLIMLQHYVNILEINWILNIITDIHATTIVEQFFLLMNPHQP
nr:MAG TPA: hypothetical protein [Caudoviricetes sp.]